LSKVIKISNSGITRYNGCAASYKYHYLDRLRSPVRSSALLFGSAIDAACNHFLENHATRAAEESLLAEGIDIFKSKWEQQVDQNSKTGEMIDLPLNPYIKYFKNDYDHDLLSEQHLDDIAKYHKKISPNGEDVIDYQGFRSALESNLKTTSWLKIPEAERIAYNYGSWLSLSIKGPMMLESYFRHILPKFKQILTLQRQIELVDDKDNIVQGVAEFVAVLEDGKICLVDNKTAASPYEQDSVKNSQQLALYKTILNTQAATEGADWQIPIEVAAYAVMGKKIARKRVCKLCNHEATGSHKTCNNIIDGTRCNGEWATSYSAPHQFIVDEIPDEFGQAVLENASNIITCVDKGVFPKNFEKCYNVFGGTCEFLEHCRGKGDKTLIKLEESNGKK
jgi:hypothetical protein